MVDTLNEIRREAAEQPVALIVGQDSADTLDQWHRWEELTELAHLVIMRRPGRASKPASGIADNLAVNRTGKENGAAVADGIKGFTNLSGTDGSPVSLGFADLSTPDFTLQPDARLLKEIPPFEPIPFDRIGLFKDEYRAELPAR